MTILWCGGEEIDFAEVIGGTTSITTFYDTSYSRAAVEVKDLGDHCKSPVIGNMTSMWLSSRIRINFCRTSTLTSTGWGFEDSLTGAWLGIGSGSEVGKLGIWTFDGATEVKLAEESGVSLPESSFQRIDLQVISYGTNGTVNAFVNGVLVCTYTGDLTVNSATKLDRVYSRCTGPIRFAFYISEVIVADEDTRAMRLKTHAPNAAGDASDWTGDYTSIDEAILDDADTIKSTASGESFQCNLTGVPTGDFICKAVKVAVRNINGSTTGAQIGIKTNSAVDLGAVNSTGGVWENSERMYQLNPETGVAFTQAELEALQLAVESTSLT